MNTCKVCSLSESERWEAERRLRTKRSHPAISEELIALGINVKAGELSKHYNNHMEREQTRDIETPNLLGAIEIERKLEELSKEALERDYVGEVIERYKEIHVLLGQATKVNLIMIMDQLLKNATDLGRFPSEEIRGCTNLMNMMRQMPMYTDKSLTAHFLEMSRKAKEKQQKVVN